MRNVLVIEAHPDAGSFNTALARAYADGARESGAKVEVLALQDLAFDPVLHHGYRQRQALEPDLARAQELLTWSNHVVFAYPTWWGAPPAILKGFLDRTLLPGYAFRFREGSNRWDRLLAGRSARLLVTMDFPTWYYRWVYGAPGDRAMADSTLGFCGIKPVKRSHFGEVRTSTPERRARWLFAARELGARD